MKLCMGCMNQIEENLTICPYCNFEQTSLRRESYYLDPGTIIGGKYILGRDISYGGHTVSYLGLDAESNRKVIIREYLPSDFSTRSYGEKEVTIYSGDGKIQFEEGLSKFLNEANDIQQLGSPEGIARVYDCVVENDTGYVISEYVEGRTLKDILASGKRYSAKEAKAFIVKILKGLVPLHRKDIIHCDISPETIMVTNSGEIKLMDFGGARYVTTANSKSLSIILKRGYAPAEQYRSKVKRGPWTDVYALGAVMYQMLTGKVPQEAVERALSDELKAPSKLGVSIPENMENALLNALNVNMEERTQSAEAFLKELNSPTVKRIKPKRKSNKTAKFPIWAKGLVACLCCAVIVGGVYLFRMIGGDSGKVRGDVVPLEDMVGMTEDEAKNYIEKLSKDNGWDITFAEGESVFDLSQDEGMIAGQDVPAGTALKEGKTDSSPENSDSSEEKIGGSLVRDKAGKVTGTITCKVYTNKKIRYEEIRELSAIQLAKKLDIDTENNDTQFIGNDSDEAADCNYYDILSLNVDGTPISRETIWNEEGEIEYKKDAISIEYAKAPFFYWEKLPDFTGKNLSGHTYPVYEWKAETDKAPAQVEEKELIGTNLVAADYYSIFEERPVGYVVEQTEQPGELLDTSKDLKEPFLHVIADCKELDGLTGYKAKETLEDWGGNIIVKPGGSGDMSQPVLYADIQDADGNKIKEFKLEEPVTVILYLRVKPTPVPTRAPSYNGVQSSHQNNNQELGDGDTGH